MSYKTYKRALEREYKDSPKFKDDFDTYYQQNEQTGKSIIDYEQSHTFEMKFDSWCRQSRKLHPDTFKQVFEETTLGNLNLVYEHVPTLKRLFNYIYKE